jgi:alanine racemase
MSWRNRVEISLTALAANIAWSRERAGQRQVIAVVKADAYGLGIERVAPVLWAEGVRIFAIAALSEAERLRAVLPQARIILLSSPLPFERAAYVDLDVEICCSDVSELQALARIGETSGHAVGVHLAVDTGMGRTGCAPDDVLELLHTVAMPGLRLRGLMSHYSAALNEAASTRQEQLFLAAAQHMPDDPEFLIHLANSAGLLERPSIGNAVRVGLLWTGSLAVPRPSIPLRPVITWSSRLSLVKELPAGHGVSYGSRFVCSEPQRIGLVPVGYADGYPLAASGKAHVIVGDQRCPVLGRVTMDYLIVGIPPSAHVGDEVYLAGGPAEIAIKVSEIARWAGTIPYDILCGLRGRCQMVSRTSEV